jgi:spore germination cell wall hydrolase CwlJ-like protein
MKKLIAILLLLPSLTKASELTCMADNIYFESRGEPESGQFLVGFITMNRVMDKRWPNTVCDVVYQSGQFEWVDNGHSNTPYKSEVYYKIIEIASIVMQAKETEEYGVYFNQSKCRKNQVCIIAGAHKFYN